MPEITSFEKRVGLHSGVFRTAVVHALDLALASPEKLLWSAKVRLAARISCRPEALLHRPGGRLSELPYAA
jgi:hypothetical protein